MRRGEYRQAAGIRRAQRRNCESNYAAFSHSLCFSFLRQLAQQPHRQPNRVGDALNLRCSFATTSFDFYYPAFNRIGSVNSAPVKSSRNFYPVSRLLHTLEFNRGRALRTSGQCPPLPAALVCRGIGRLDHRGQKLAYVYFEDEPGPAIGSQVVHEG